VDWASLTIVALILSSLPLADLGTTTASLALSPLNDPAHFTTTPANDGVQDTEAVLRAALVSLRVTAIVTTSCLPATGAAGVVEAAAKTGFATGGAGVGEGLDGLGGGDGGVLRSYVNVQSDESGA
jgi:hypothetical protein